jgi:hypothetical protein
MQESFDEPRASWWSEFKERWFKWERITLAGKVIEKGWVVPQPLGIALLLVLLGGVGSLYWRLTDKATEQSAQTQAVREMLIRLDQRLIDKNDHDNQRFQQLEQQIEGSKSHQAAIESLFNKEIAQLKAKR